MDNLPAVSRRSEAVPYLGMEGYKYSHEGFYLLPDKHRQSIRALVYPVIGNMTGRGHGETLRRFSSSQW